MPAIPPKGIADELRVRDASVSGFRVSLVTGLGLAAIGSTVSSRTLGEVIVAGLLSGNGSFVVQGAGLVGGLALLVSWPLSAAAGCGAVARRR